MICLKTFQRKHPKDFSRWEDWVSFDRENYNYSQTFSCPFDFIGKCKEWELPSYHPYWSNLVKQRIANDIVELKRKYEECIDNPEKIKFYFNKTTNINDVLKIIEQKSELTKGVEYIKTN